MRDYHREALCHDPVHGYIPFTSGPLPAGEVSEQELIDHPWVQRLRQIHQLQTAWYVFPSAEHTRFQHVLGAMHLASRAAAALYDSLREECPDCPSRGAVECLLRVAALLHDVGHGPFGHFFDAHFLADFGETHETIGSAIIRRELADVVTRIRRCPAAALEAGERLDPEAVSFLITRPRDEAAAAAAPRWLVLLRSLFSGLYTVDNLDFVLRDAFMSGFSPRAFDLDRLLHYSFFSPRGLTIHARGLPALIRFLETRAELFRSLYFHRTVRAIDLELEDLFRASRPWLFSGSPLEHLDAYRRLTEWSLLVDVSRWESSADPEQRSVGQRWSRWLRREVPWKTAVERTLVFDPAQGEAASLFSKPEFVLTALREALPRALAALPLKVDVARHVHRPGTRGPAAGQNFLFDPAAGAIRELTEHPLFRRLPLSYRICRVYAESHEHDAALAAALDRLVGTAAADDPTNM